MVCERIREKKAAGSSIFTPILIQKDALAIYQSFSMVYGTETEALTRAMPMAAHTIAIRHSLAHTFRISYRFLILPSYSSTENTMATNPCHSVIVVSHFAHCPTNVKRTIAHFNSIFAISRFIESSKK